MPIKEIKEAFLSFRKIKSNSKLEEKIFPPFERGVVFLKKSMRNE